MDRPMQKKQDLTTADVCVAERDNAKGSEVVDASAGVEAPPFAPMLLESLRSVGYSTASALADLVDNSIAASARLIRISVTFDTFGHAAIVDDGNGMDEQELIIAMRLGSRDPTASRSTGDLGRFGLGLKTASLSQCRRLTVVTLKNGNLSLARWDLDDCRTRGTWWLSRPRASEIPSAVLEQIRAQGRGTAVVWEKMDRLLESGGEQSVLEAADHLALVFHRFLAGEIDGTLQILLNERPLPIVDPFLAGHIKGQSLHPETLMIGGFPVQVSPFVLPFPSKLKHAELERIGGRESLKISHGFYVYRGGRLVVPGGWFRIVPSDQLVRLARIRVDVPVELDHLWKVDIRKTVAEPPHALRPHLKRIVGDVTIRSRRVYQHKGTSVNDSEHIPLWKRFEFRDKGATWQINRSHPYLQSFSSNPSIQHDLESLLKLLENTLPLQDIHIHTVNDQPIADRSIPNEEELDILARRILGAFADDQTIASRLLDNLPLTEPFSSNPEAAKRIAQRLQNEFR